MLARYPIKFGGDLTNLGLQIIDFALQVIRNRLASACARYALASASAAVCLTMSALPPIADIS